MQTVAATTKPTASQMIAAKRAAKKESAVKKYARENSGNKRADRNKLANIATIHAMNKMAMHKGEPQSLDAQLTENIKNLMHYESMVYDYDRISVTVFEKLIRAMRVVACIYADSELSKTTNQAQAAIESLRCNDSDDLSPNQRREILKTVLKLIQYCEAYDAVVPERPSTRSVFIVRACKSPCTPPACTTDRNAISKPCLTSSTVSRYAPSQKTLAKKKTCCVKRY